MDSRAARGMLLIPANSMPNISRRRSRAHQLTEHGRGRPQAANVAGDPRDATGERFRDGADRVENLVQRGETSADMPHDQRGGNQAGKKHGAARGRERDRNKHVGRWTTHSAAANASVHRTTPATPAPVSSSVSASRGTAPR